MNQWSAIVIFLKIIDGKSIVDGNEVVNHEEHEFSRMRGGFAGEFCRRFYLLQTSWFK